MSESVDAIRAAVKARTGFDILVEPEPSLNVLATVKMAGGELSMHVIRFNPKASDLLDYLVALQCGCILRMHEVPAADRFYVVSTPSGRKEAGQLVETHLKRTFGSALSAEVLQQVRDQMYDGLITQLRSLPVALRVDDWLRRECPALAEQQKDAMQRRELFGRLFRS
jgi:hypothetical protein